MTTLNVSLGLHQLLPLSQAFHNVYGKYQTRLLFIVISYLNTLTPTLNIYD